MPWPTSTNEVHRHHDIPKNRHERLARSTTVDLGERDHPTLKSLISLANFGRWRHPTTKSLILLTDLSGWGHPTSKSLVSLANLGKWGHPTMKSSISLANLGGWRHSPRRYWTHWVTSDDEVILPWKVWSHWPLVDLGELVILYQILWSIFSQQKVPRREHQDDYGHGGSDPNWNYP